MFLAWGHTGPIQPWSSKSRPQQKLPTALCPLLRRPFYTMRRRREVGPGASSGFWTAPSANQRRPASRGAPPAPPRAVCPCTRKHRRAHAHTAEHTRVLRSGAGGRDGRAGGYGGFGVRVLAGVMIFGGGFAHSEVSAGLAGWGQAMWHVALRGPRCHATAGAAPRPCDPPQQPPRSWGTPKTHPRLPTGTLLQRDRTPARCRAKATRPQSIPWSVPKSIP